MFLLFNLKIEDDGLRCTNASMILKFAYTYLSFSDYESWESEQKAYNLSRSSNACRFEPHFVLSKVKSPFSQQIKKENVEETNQHLFGVVQCLPPF